MTFFGAQRRRKLRICKADSPGGAWYAELPQATQRDKRTLGVVGFLQDTHVILRRQPKNLCRKFV